jgi:hypothetical protein
MRALVKTGVVMLVLAFFLIGIAFSVLRSKGNASPANREGRNVMTETRKLGTGIAAISLNGPINLTLRQGAVSSLVVSGEQRVLGNVETVQEGGTLRIGTQGMLLHHRQPIRVTLVLPSVARLDLGGSGDSTINGFSGDRLEMHMNGSGTVKFNGRYRDIDAGVNGSGEMELNGGSSDKVDVQLAGGGQMTVVGSCKRFKAAQSGSGDLIAEHMEADEASVELQGSGSSTIHAKKYAGVIVTGSGDVNVLGNPSERKISRTGTGDVSFAKK